MSTAIVDWVHKINKTSIQSAVRKKPRNTMPLETRFSELIVTKMISKISNFDDENPETVIFRQFLSKFMTSKNVDFISQ